MDGDWTVKPLTSGVKLRTWMCQQTTHLSSLTCEHWAWHNERLFLLYLVKPTWRPTGALEGLPVMHLSIVFEYCEHRSVW